MESMESGSKVDSNVLSTSAVNPSKDHKILIIGAGMLLKR